jgi:hypothetical protein
MLRSTRATGAAASARATAAAQARPAQDSSTFTNILTAISNSAPQATDIPLLSLGEHGKEPIKPAPKGQTLDGQPILHAVSFGPR